MEQGAGARMGAGLEGGAFEMPTPAVCLCSPDWIPDEFGNVQSQGPCECGFCFGATQPLPD